MFSKEKEIILSIDGNEKDEKETFDYYQENYAEYREMVEGNRTLSQNQDKRLFGAYHLKSLYIKEKHDRFL